MHDVQGERTASVMKPDTVRWIAQTIRNERERLSYRENWWRTHPESDVRTEAWREILFFKMVWDIAEEMVNSGLRWQLGGAPFWRRVEQMAARKAQAIHVTKNSSGQ